MGLKMNFFWKNVVNIFIPFIASTAIVFTISSYIKNIGLGMFIILGLIYSIIYIALYLCVSATESELKNIKNLIAHVKR